jgi:SAM-dependent methyltransferase
MTDWAKMWDETYRQQPNIYGEAPSRIATELANLLRQRTSPVRVLDLGCGYGRDSLYFAQQGFEVVALDCSPAAIAMLQNRLAGLELAGRITPIVADALQGIPAPDGHFDAVYAYLFFCLAFTDADLTRLFAECARVLKPDGLLAGTVRSDRDPSYGKGELVEPDMFALPNAVRHFFRKEYLRRKLTQAGFELRQLDCYDETVGESSFRNLLAFIAVRKTV